MRLKLATKAWKATADALINEGVKSGEIMIHDGKDISEARGERRKLAMRVVLLLNVTKVGKFGCFYAANLVVVDIPEGIKSIGHAAFCSCHSLTTVSFPTTLISIGSYAFN
ncbi:hypothetical protein TrLO_g13220 [Triparma laevis f. longispina]|nr:hypothetical protein TrLO_g13220 [Triparma laevis f. longispina]